jgi:hypothetical protein
MGGKALYKKINLDDTRLPRLVWKEIGWQLVKATERDGDRTLLTVHRTDHRFDILFILAPADQIARAEIVEIGAHQTVVTLDDHACLIEGVDRQTGVTPTVVAAKDIDRDQARLLHGASIGVGSG